MSSSSTPSKKTAAKKTAAAATAPRKATAKKAAAPPRKTTAPQPRNGTPEPGPTPDPVTGNEIAAEAVDENTVIKNFLAERRRHRQLLALKIICYVLAAGAATFIGLTIRQLVISSPMAGAYAGLAGVFVAATGVTSTVYFLIRRKDTKDG